MSVIVVTLIAEYVRVRNKLDGASQRLLHAQSQAALEEAAIVELQRDLDMLADAVISNGGELPAAAHPDAMNGRTA